MIYFDNSATTALSDAAKQAVSEAMEIYGNPSSRHSLGLDAARVLGTARERLGRALGLSRPNAENLIFTSCGSEANNTAIFGGVYSKDRRRGGRIIISDSEHPSVENAVKRLEADGFEVVRVSTRGGVIDRDALMAAVDDKLILVSLMLVNNETGAVYNVKELFSEIRRRAPGAILHCDAVQGFLKIPFSARSLGADMISLSAHKIHGPKGVGALYISPDTVKQKKIVPYLCGGGQEGGLRSGTENVMGIAGFGAAAEDGFAHFAKNVELMTAVRDECERAAIAAGASVNVPKGARAPHVLSVTLPGIKSETMLNFLSGKGICVSAGSACSSRSRHISSSLVGFGLTPEEADCTIRLSFSEYNGLDEARALADALCEGIDTLVRIRR